MHDRLQRLEAETSKADSDAESLVAMKKAWLQAGLPIALDSGAKLTKRELTW